MESALFLLLGAAWPPGNAEFAGPKCWPSEGGDMRGHRLPPGTGPVRSELCHLCGNARFWPGSLSPKWCRPACGEWPHRHRAVTFGGPDHRALPSIAADLPIERAAASHLLAEGRAALAADYLSNTAASCRPPRPCHSDHPTIETVERVPAAPAVANRPQVRRCWPTSKRSRGLKLFSARPERHRRGWNCGNYQFAVTSPRRGFVSSTRWLRPCQHLRASCGSRCRPCCVALLNSFR